MTLLDTRELDTLRDFLTRQGVTPDTGDRHDERDAAPLRQWAEIVMPHYRRHSPVHKVSVLRAAWRETSARLTVCGSAHLARRHVPFGHPGSPTWAVVTGALAEDLPAAVAHALAMMRLRLKGASVDTGQIAASLEALARAACVDVLFPATEDEWSRLIDRAVEKVGRATREDAGRRKAKGRDLDRRSLVDTMAYAALAVMVGIPAGTARKHMQAWRLRRRYAAVQVTT